MNFLKIVLATVLSVFLTGQAYATEERVILATTATDDAKWNAYLEELAGQKPLQFNGKAVKGYDPETGLVSTGAVMQYYCLNRDPLVQKACEKPGEQYLRFVARNGWTEIEVSADELRQQARERKVIFPLIAQATAPVAAASAPTTTATSVAVTAEQLRALEQSFAQVKQALEAQVASNASAITQLREGLASKDRELALLREEQKKAASPQALVAITAKLTAETDARRTLEQKLKGEMSAVATAAGEAAANAAAPALARANAAAEAASAAVGLVDAIDDKANTAQHEANNAKRAAETAGNAASTAQYLAGGALVLVLIFSGVVVFYRRSQQAAINEAVGKQVTGALGSYTKYVEEVTGDLQSLIETNAHGLKAVTERQREAGHNHHRVVNAVNAIAERLAVVEVATGADAWSLLEGDKEAVKMATESLATDQVSEPVSITIAEGTVVHVTFVGIDADYVFVNGVTSLNERRRRVAKKRLYATLKGAHLRGELVGITMPTLESVVPTAPRLIAVAA